MRRDEQTGTDIDPAPTPRAARSASRVVDLLPAVIRSRLGGRLALAVFGSILFVEAAILIPSYVNYERDLLARLEHVGHAAVTQAFKVHAHARERDLLIYGARLARHEDIGGGAVYRADGSLIGAFGEAPELSPNAVIAGAPPRLRSADGKRYDVYWNREQTGLPVDVVARLDAEWIGPSLRAFVLRIAGLVMLISAIVCGTTMFIFNRAVLAPILGMRDQLIKAADDATQPDAYVLAQTRTDELGEVMRAFNVMMRRIAESVQALMQARGKLAEANEGLEAKVAERTQKLSLMNDRLRTEIAQRKRIEEQLRHDAFYDRLTQLPNRTLFIDRAGHAIQRALRTRDGGFSVLLINIDRFKIVNDSLGYHAGDALLNVVAERLRALFRVADTLARVGGDEFAVLLENVSAEDHLDELVARIREALEPPIMIEAQEVHCTASIGVVTDRIGNVLAESILQDAAIALRRAKDMGGNRCETFVPSMREEPTRVLAIESDLRAAVKAGGQLCLYYQPIVRLEDGAVAGFEALVRWRHPQRGLILPIEFITLAEETGLILPIGRWVLEESLRQLLAWDARRPLAAPYVAVNVSVRQLMDERLVKDVDAVLARWPVDPERLTLEVTESSLLRNPGMAANVFGELKKRNVRLAIDDFGTGYSSLSYLQHFPFDLLKIDKTFITEARRSDNGRHIIRKVAELATALGMETVVEGVETECGAVEVRDMGCGYGQGYYFSLPLESESALSMAIDPPMHWRCRGSKPARREHSLVGSQ